MPPGTRVVVCGNSLYMVSLAAGLRANRQLDVTRIPTNLAAAPERIHDLQAEVVAFDLAELPIDLPVALLRDQPDILLLGMDPTREELLVLSGHHARAVSLADLVEIITERAYTAAPQQTHQHEEKNDEETHPS